MWPDNTVLMIHYKIWITCPARVSIHVFRCFCDQILWPAIENCDQIMWDVDKMWPVVTIVQNDELKNMNFLSCKSLNTSSWCCQVVIFVTSLWWVWPYIEWSNQVWPEGKKKRKKIMNDPSLQSACKCFQGTTVYVLPLQNVTRYNLTG